MFNVSNINNPKQNFYFKKWGIEEFKRNLPLIKALRKTYKYYPYLYAYNEVDEQYDLQSYLDTKENLDVFVCIYEEKLVGISLGCPLRKDFRICSDLYKFEQHRGVYYFGDIIVDKTFWGFGIANNLYTQHIKHVKHKGFKKIIALIIDPASDDPRKPENYKKPTLWKKHNFHETKHYIKYSWQTWNKNFTDSVNEEHILKVYEKGL